MEKNGKLDCEVGWEHRDPVKKPVDLGGPNGKARADSHWTRINVNST